MEPASVYLVTPQNDYTVYAHDQSALLSALYRDGARSRRAGKDEFGRVSWCGALVVIYTNGTVLVQGEGASEVLRLLKEKYGDPDLFKLSTQGRLDL